MSRMKRYRLDFCLLRGKGFSEKKTSKENREYPDDETAKKTITAELRELLKDWEKIHAALFRGNDRVKTWGIVSLSRSQYMKRMDELAESIPGLQTMRFGPPNGE